MRVWWDLKHQSSRVYTRLWLPHYWKTCWEFLRSSSCLFFKVNSWCLKSIILHEAVKCEALWSPHFPDISLSKYCLNYRVQEMMKLFPTLSVPLHTAQHYCVVCREVAITEVNYLYSDTSHLHQHRTSIIQLSLASWDAICHKCTMMPEQIYTKKVLCNFVWTFYCRVQLHI